MNDRSAASTVTSSLEQVRAVLDHHLRALWEDPTRARILPPVMLWGPPGIGKSAVVRQACEEEGIGFVDVRLAQREPVDVRGLPVPKDGVVQWLLPDEYPRDRGSRGIILFDELTAADRTLQVAAYEFILDRRLGSLYEVPPGWYVMAAGNRTSDRAVATTMSSALANRFCHLDVAPDLEGWVRWAQVAGVHPDVVGFLRFRPNLFLDMKGNLERGWPSPRAWERVGLETDLVDRLDPSTFRVLIAGLVDSYLVFPPSLLPPLGDVTDTVVRTGAEAFLIAAQITAPLLLIGIIFNIGLGILARLMPQLPVLFVALPAQIGIGLTVFGLTLSAGMLIFLDRFADIWTRLFAAGL